MGRRMRGYGEEDKRVWGGGQESMERRTRGYGEEDKRVWGGQEGMGRRKMIKSQVYKTCMYTSG